MPNQINSAPLLDDKTQAWLKSWMQEPRYCHYFAVCFADDASVMGNWNAPFYSLEEAQLFESLIQGEYPDHEFMLIEGVLHINGAMRSTPNEFWAKWQRKHKARIASLHNQGACHA